MLDNSKLQPVVEQTPPVTFMLTKWLQNIGVRGGHRLEQMCIESDMWNSYSRFELSEKVFIDIPLWKRPYDKAFMLNYESMPIAAVSDAMNSCDEQFLMFDCGADIGMFTALLAAQTDRISEAIGFEPNKESFGDLWHNYSLLPFKAFAMDKAVSNFYGNADLAFPDFDGHDHAAFITPSDHGDIKAVTVDSFNLFNLPGLFLKIDVEGEELNVIRGARKTIETAQNALILFEAHPKQSDRVAVDPCDIIKELLTIHPFDYQITEAPDTQLDLDKPFFSQTEKIDRRVFNILLSFKPQGER
ncbi:MAG: FkbM family methyltransferase [Pseudomonadales bacterium]|nr:FkbM family methyltransferase [Pseudomonadales bacterium]